MRSISKIIIHCSATPEGRHFTVEQIRSWHTAPKPKGNGWRDIGYHFVIYLAGSIHTGRPIEQIGAHCSGHNAHSIGICYIGGCDAADPTGRTPKDTRTPAQKASLVSLVKRLKARYPKATVHGHNELTCKRAQSQARLSYAECSRQCAECEFANKACPSFNVQKDTDLCAL